MIYDVIVIGAGVVGALTARELARYDLKVLVLEAEVDAAMGATKANSAIVHGGFAEGSDTLKGRLCAVGRHLFPELEAELNFGFRTTGSLVVSFDADRTRLEALLKKGQDNGLADLAIWGPEELREKEPAVSRNATGALWCAGAGVCSPWDLAYAALENARANGVDFRTRAPVSGVDFRPGETGRWVLHSGTESWSTRWVIQAAGLGGPALERLAGVPVVPLHPRTGEYLLLESGTGSLVNSVIFGLPGPMGKGVLVGPTYQNNLLIGPDARNEDAGESGEWRHTHAERIRSVLEQAQLLVDGIEVRRAIRTFAGVRAAASTSDFVVGPADRESRPGWHRATGIQSPGLTSSPALARLLVQGLGCEGLSLVPRSDFDPSRKALPSHRSRRPPRLKGRELTEAVNRDPGDPERVVCRCEQIREKDLAEALARGLPVESLDAIKRRTRAGMGACQGQFCRPRVSEWLERQGQHGPWQTDVEARKLNRVVASDLRKEPFSQ